LHSNKLPVLGAGQNGNRVIITYLNANNDSSGRSLGGELGGAPCKWVVCGSATHHQPYCKVCFQLVFNFLYCIKHYIFGTPIWDPNLWRLESGDPKIGDPELEDPKNGGSQHWEPQIWTPNWGPLKNQLIMCSLFCRTAIIWGGHSEWYGNGI
jgi:hypothetical protein